MTAPLAFVDTETTGLDPNRHEVWEVFLHLRSPDPLVSAVERHWFLPIDLGRADPIALTIGRFYERTANVGDTWEAEASPTPLATFAREFAELTHGAHLVAAVPSFDDAFLRRLLVANGACPGWHYHLVDVEALAIGYLRGLSRGIAVAGDVSRFGASIAASREVAAPPWNSSKLTELLGIRVDETTKHTAEGDVRWAMAIYDKVMNDVGLASIPPVMAAEKYPFGVPS